MGLNTRLYSVTSLRMHGLMPYPDMSSWYVQRQHHLNLFQHYYTRIIKISLPTLTNMTSPTKPTTVKPTDDGQFVGCVELANRNCSISHLICRWKPAIQYSWNGINRSIILWYIQIHPCNLP